MAKYSDLKNMSVPFVRKESSTTLDHSNVANVSAGAISGRRTTAAPSSQIKNTQATSLVRSALVNLSPVLQLN